MSSILRPHYPLADAVATNLKLIFGEGKYADKVIERALKMNRKWGARDRRFIAETTYNIVRNYRLLHESAGSKSPWMLIAAYFVMHEIPFPGWKELSTINAELIRKTYEEKKKIFAVAQSVPEWLDALGRKELGNEVWEKELPFLNEEAKVVLRANTLKIKAAELQKSLRHEEIETALFPAVPEALIVKQRQNLFLCPQFKDGLFELQDISSQQVARFMQLEEGMRVIDACAGAGGKSLHISALMNGKGKIISMDVEEWKLNELKKRAVRAGAHNIETRVIDNKTIKRYEAGADRVLMDVPCSGLGVLRRNPDAKWKLTETSIEEVKKKQEEILREYSIMVKPGGKLIYATCSILPSENSEQVKKFLAANSEFSFEKEKIIMPSSGFDGFYMCRMIRKNPEVDGE